jgi:hypothetical protein
MKKRMLPRQKKPELEVEKRIIRRRLPLAPLALGIFAVLCMVIPVVAASCGSSEGPYITTTSPPTGQVGVAYWYALDTQGGSPPCYATLSNLPPGLTFANSGISGTPTEAGTYTVSITVTDSAGASSTIALSINITQPECKPEVWTLSFDKHYFFRTNQSGPNIPEVWGPLGKASVRVVASTFNEMADSGGWYIGTFQSGRSGAIQLPHVGGSFVPINESVGQVDRWRFVTLGGTGAGCIVIGNGEGLTNARYCRGATEVHGTLNFTIRYQGGSSSGTADWSGYKDQ